MAKTKPVCLMCKERPARYVCAEYRDKSGEKQEYINGTKSPLFCSVRCSANYALLWFDFGGFADELEDCGHAKPPDR